jgi:FkbM family methyltransferase
MISRIFNFLKNLTNCVNSIGLKNTFKIFFKVKNSQKGITTIHLNNYEFFIRNNTDIGASFNFYKKQFILKDNSEDPIEYIIDGGANIGQQTIRFINSYKNLKKIVAVELDTGSFEYLKRNTEKCKKVCIINKALSNSNKERFYVSSNNSEMSKITDKDTGKKIESISINEIIKINDLPRVDLLKLNIEGEEPNLFLGDTSWLSITNCIAFNNANLNNFSQDILKKIFKNGDYNIYNLGQFIVLIKSNLNWKAKYEHSNFKSFKY